jgi:CRISPR system Cascade subunit CasC
MTAPRFLQIHTLHSYTAALLNRDDTGLAKRLHRGGATPTRISSQCLKRHWRMAKDERRGKDDPHALQNLAGYVDSRRSRELVTKMVIGPLRNKFPEEVAAALDQWFQYAVYSGNPKEMPKKRGQPTTDEKKSRQTLLFGECELGWLSGEFDRLAREAGDDADKAFKLGQIWVEGGGKDTDADARKDFKDNIKALRKNTGLPGGLAAALFGRMVTSDPAANIDAPIHVAHAFTVHAKEAEGDYFTAVDNLKDDADDGGADTIQETEITNGLFYGYVVVDVPGLIGNCGRDKDLAARIVHNLTYLIAEVSPGAKLGSTAPYGRAELMLIEAGDRQPRSLAGAYRRPIEPDFEVAVVALAGHLAKFDEVYATGEGRRYTSIADTEIAGVERCPIAELAEWAAEQVRSAPDA